MKGRAIKALRWTALAAGWSAYFTASASLIIADVLILIMLMIRSNERTVRPTRRVRVSPEVKRALMRYQDNRCAYCGRRGTMKTLQIDHLVPVVQGGSNDFGNLQVTCAPCNQRKGLQTDEAFRWRYSRLIPSAPLTYPVPSVSQAAFRAETRRTRQSEGTRRFRNTKYITRRQKIGSGSLACAGAAGVAVAVALSQAGAQGYLLLLPTIFSGGLVGGGLWLRAIYTGAMEEPEG